MTTTLDSSQAISPACQRALAFLDGVKVMLAEKNRRYGDSAANPIRVWSKASPEEQILVRLDDKLSRITRGSGREDEDVLKDIVGYIALLVAVRTSP